VNFTQTWKNYTLLVNDRLCPQQLLSKHEQKDSEMEALKIRKTPPKKSKRPQQNLFLKKKTGRHTDVNYMSGSNWQNLQSRSVLQGLFYE
jgi:hypothetical protein